MTKNWLLLRVSEPRCKKSRSSGFPTRSDTNRAVQSLNMARGLKFRFQKVEGLYYPCSENKGADQLRGYREADLRLCFRIYKKLVSHDKAQVASCIPISTYESHHEKTCFLHMPKQRRRSAAQ